MSHGPDNQNSTQQLLLDESIDITVINKFYDQLKIMLSEGSAININAAQVQRIDTSALQLLCSWYIEAKAKGMQVTWSNIDGVFYQSARLLGVAKSLALE